MILKPIQQSTSLNQEHNQDTIKFLFNIRKYSSRICQITSAKHSSISKILDKCIPIVIGILIEQHRKDHQSILKEVSQRPQEQLE